MLCFFYRIYHLSNVHSISIVYCFSFLSSPFVGFNLFLFVYYLECGMLFLLHSIHNLFVIWTDFDVLRLYFHCKLDCILNVFFSAARGLSYSFWFHIVVAMVSPISLVIQAPVFHSPYSHPCRCYSGLSPGILVSTPFLLFFSFIVTYLLFSLSVGISIVIGVGLMVFPVPIIALLIKAFLLYYDASVRVSMLLHFIPQVMIRCFFFLLSWALTFFSHCLLLLYFCRLWLLVSLLPIGSQSFHADCRVHYPFICSFAYCCFGSSLRLSWLSLLL